jgi:hypothetical protein
MAEALVRLGAVLACMMHVCMSAMCSYLFIFRISQCLPLFIFTMLQAESLSLWVCRGKLNKLCIGHSRNVKQNEDVNINSQVISFKCRAIILILSK